MKFREVQGNLMSTNASICHCVSEDLAMTRGIAKTIKHRFRRITELRGKGTKTGDVAVLQVGPRFVYNLVTKENYWEKPTYGTLRSSLERMKEHAEQNSVRKICMPRIGCGLDRLKWTKVKQMVIDVFKNDQMEIVVYVLQNDAKI